MMFPRVQRTLGFSFVRGRGLEQHGHAAGGAIKGAVAKQLPFKMLKTAVFTVQIGQNVENSKANFRK